jgi:Zn-finger nucleic acid-binding protein
MLCPICARSLKPVEREGVPIDYCQQCGGIWLDQGKLTELIQRETLDSLRKGQDVLMAARRDREYDRLSGIDAAVYR